MNRHDVHLSTDVEAAQAVGGRGAEDVVIVEVDSYRMHPDGAQFRISEDCAWLVATVPARYLRRLP
jgi:putative RNA 2'-phosphotransferase